MSADIIIILIFCVMGLVAHGSRRQPWLAWVLRVIFAFSCVAEFFAAEFPSPDSTGPWTSAVTWSMTIASGAMLFLPCRKLLSYGLTVVNQIIGGAIFIALYKKRDVKAAFTADSIFVPTSIPHLNALWIYVTVLGCLLNSMNLSDFRVPAIPIPLPVPLDALFSYNFLGLIVLSICGCGIFVTRKPREILRRLGFVKPAGWQVGLALGMIVVTAAYDYLWSLYTHQSGGGIAAKLSTYNGGTFGASGALPAFIIAIATGICAGIGEETLIRGALVPVFGALPAGILHGALHGQFQHAPILILQVAGWSTMMGVVRRYTNTTTTTITHVGWNFVMTFLFAFNP